MVTQMAVAHFKWNDPYSSITLHYGHDQLWGLTEVTTTPLTIISSPYQLNNQVEQ